MNLYMGIDQSFTSTGVVITTADGNVISVSVLRSDPATDIFTRAVAITTQICETISAHEIDMVAIEGLAFGTRGDAARDLAGLQFVIITTIRRLFPDLPVHIVSPKTLKKFATGKGTSDKRAMYDSLPEQAKQTFLDHKIKATKGLYDVTDAYWISRYVETHTNGSE